MNTQEHSGPTFMGTEAEVIKQRVTGFDEIRNQMDQTDITDHKSWVAFINNTSATLMADEMSLPHVAYSMASRMLKVQVKTKNDTDLALAVEGETSKTFSKIKDRKIF